MTATPEVPVLLLDGVGNGRLIRESEPLPPHIRYAAKPYYVVMFLKTEAFHEGARIYLLDKVKQVPRVRRVTKYVYRS